MVGNVAQDALTSLSNMESAASIGEADKINLTSRSTANLNFGETASYYFGQSLGAAVLASGIPELGTSISSGAASLMARFGVWSGASIEASNAIMPTVGETLYRVWGDGSPASGGSWTNIDPLSVTNYRNIAGLPEENTSRFVSEGILLDTTNVIFRPALQIGPNIGGLNEFVVPNIEDQIQITRVSGVNPQF